MRKIIEYFINRPLVANVLMFGMILASFLIWNKIGKEEMPDFAMNWLRISLRYPGASAADVESFITKPIEEKLKSISSLDTVTSTSSFSSSSFRVGFEANIPDLNEKIQEVKDAIDSVVLPREADDPVYRQFKSSEKAIIDIGIYLESEELLSIEARQRLQSYVLAFKNKMLSLPEISGVQESGYLRPELQIKVRPELLKKYDITMNQVRNSITSQNIRKPIGMMKDKSESEVTISAELDTVEALNKVIVSAGFQGQKLKLSELAKIEEGFEDRTSISKIQGREGIILNIQKSSQIDILSAQQAVVDFIENFEKNNINKDLRFVLIDDESYDVKNRLEIIGSNGLVGFVLIVIVLFLFLDFKSGIWVGMGVPFSLAFTLCGAYLFGYTINNVTLAAIIIVLGIVVDDAIIIAENIVRKLKEKTTEPISEAVMGIGSPVIASVLTTCAAFLPFYFFTGHFGVFVKYIPMIIFLMLFASLIESFFILPSHILSPSKFLDLENHKWLRKVSEKREKYIDWLETKYERLLKHVLGHRIIVLLTFVLLLVFSGYIVKTDLKFSMFPREESRDFRLQVTAPEDTNRNDMAKLVTEVENVFLKDKRGIVTSVRTSIGQNRRGGEVKENEASVRVEIVPPTERNISLNELLKDWEEKTAKLENFTKIKYQRGWFGSESGSPIEIEIQENNDTLRAEVVAMLKSRLEANPKLKNIELEKPVTKQEYKLIIDKAKASQLGVNFELLTTTLRAYIQGDILYTLNAGEEEVDLRFTSLDDNKDDIDKVLELTVANEENYLLPIKNIVTVVKQKKPANIQRINFKRATSIYADINKEANATPLQIAGELEKDIFPDVLKGKPSVNLFFRGEVENSRESSSDFLMSVLLALGLIYVLLVLLFDSLLTPFLIGAIIPFGVVGVVLAFWLHGFNQFGFFAVVGTLGMIGVVINDAIVLISRLKEQNMDNSNWKRLIAAISRTRLRAIIVTTITTVAGLFPTAYGLFGFDSMLAEMMLAMGWGLTFGMFITLVLVPCIYSFYIQARNIKLWSKNV